MSNRLVGWLVSWLFGHIIMGGDILRNTHVILRCFLGLDFFKGALHPKGLVGWVSTLVGWLKGSKLLSQSTCHHEKMT